MSKAKASQHVFLEPNHRIELSPADWRIATWRPPTLTTHPIPHSFVKSTCVAQLHNVHRSRTYYVNEGWVRVQIPQTMSREEAHFWFLAMTEGTPQARVANLPNVMAHKEVDGNIDITEVLARLRIFSGELPIEIVRPLVHLLSPKHYLEVILDQQLWAGAMVQGSYYQMHNVLMTMMEGFRTYLMPYLDFHQLDELRDYLRSMIDISTWSQPGHMPLEVLARYRMASVLGLHRELLSVISSWPDNLFPRRGSYEEWRRHPRETIFGLTDPALVERHMRRLGLLLRHEADAKGWLAHTETRGLDLLIDSIRLTRGSSVRVISVLCQVHSPEVARPLLEMRLNGLACPPLNEWFEQQVGNAVVGLLPVSTGRGKISEAARNYLREIRRRGYGEVIEKQLVHLDSSGQKRIRNQILDTDDVDYPPMDEVALFWLRKGFAELGHNEKEAFPEWLVWDDLPPLVVEGKHITSSNLRRVIVALAHTPFDTKARLFADLRRRVAANFREAFVWRLVEQWQYFGAPVKDIWVLTAIGFLGGDDSVLPLTALIRECTGNLGRHRGVQGLRALSMIGTPLAMQQLHGLARQLRSRPLRLTAKDLFDSAAKLQGLSRSELEDNMVPDLGFAGTTGPVFDYGVRQFQAILTPELHVVVRDQAGNVRENLPEPGVKDNDTQARQAIQDWRRLRRTLKEVIREQSLRLERAMVQGQRWSLRHFQQRILEQPLLGQMARMILWGGYDDRGRLVNTFRISEDLVCVNEEEEPISLTSFNSLRIVHPIEMTDENRSRWTQIWQDHALLALFPQLGRRLYHLRPEQRSHKAIMDFRGRLVNALTISGMLKTAEWETAAMPGCLMGEVHARYFPSADLTAVVYHPDVGKQPYPSHLAEHELSLCLFVRGRRALPDTFQIEEAVYLEEVPDLIRSEVCEVLATIYAKGKEM